MNRVRANQIAAKALQTRRRFLNAEASNPVCPYNLAESMGFDVRFVGIPSFEGMYLADEDMVMIAADRPEGRKCFTCAHEIGHHVLGHGTVIDEIIESGPDKKIELEADFFASMLLMPSSAVKRAGRAIGLDFDGPDSEKVYILSRYLGVSYRALLIQLLFNLKLISRSHFNVLERASVRKIKDRLYPEHRGGALSATGPWWREKSIDLVVGDLILGHCAVTETEGNAVSVIDVGTDKNVVLASQPGLARIGTDDGWSSFVRVSRKAYAGMNQYRHEEEIE